MDYGRTELADRLAAEYVAGTLRGGARRRLEALLPAHAALRSAVSAWQDRLLPLTGVIAPQAPPASLWRRIEAQLFGPPAPHATASGAPAGGGGRRQLAFWRGFSAVAGAAALGFAVLFASPGPDRPPVIVVLAPVAPLPGAAPHAAAAPFVASISADGRAVTTRPLVDVSLQPDRALELWALVGKSPPRSLGVISASGSSAVRRGALPSGTDRLAVSLEPPGGSPTGLPTGPVLFVGSL